MSIVWFLFLFNVVVLLLHFEWHCSNDWSQRGTDMIQPFTSFVTMNQPQKGCRVQSCKKKWFCRNVKMSKFFLHEFWWDSLVMIESQLSLQQEIYCRLIWHLFDRIICSGENKNLAKTNLFYLWFLNLFFTLNPLITINSLILLKVAMFNLKTHKQDKNRIIQTL